MDEIILSVKHLYAGYAENKVIEDVSASFQKGKIYSIIGPNGCGKTTFIRTISRDLKPISGEIELYGKNIFSMNTRHVARHVAMLAQKHASMSDVSVKALVRYGRFAHREWWKGNSSEDEAVVEWALDRTNMTTYSERRITELSGGELQRAWIAMSIAQKPEILLLDEPTTYLDISHQLEIMDLVSRLNREEGIAIVMVLHDINHAARYSDELLVMKDRGIYKQGEPWSILESDVIRDGFGVEAEISEDKESGRPIFFAKRVVQK